MITHATIPACLQRTVHVPEEDITFAVKIRELE
jgi:hypothetical protein